MIATAAIVLAVWIVLAAMGTAGFSFAAGRLKRNRPTYTNLAVSKPPVPEPVAIPLPADATDEEMERAIYRAFFDQTVRREFPQYFRNAA